MNTQQAIDYIEHYGWSKTRLGLDRTSQLLAGLQDPQKHLRFVHVAGSNGKGSVCAMLSSILQKAGYRTGLYISPYIQDFRERIQIDGNYIPGKELTEITEQVRAVAEEMEDHPSQFELVTAIAMVYFAKHNCDIVVLEVGMGGALDSTNVIDPPEVAVFTNIGLEHTEYLGNTLEEIAAAKAGIIKPGCCVVCYDSDPSVIRVIKNVAFEKNVPFYPADFHRITPLSRDLTGQRFLWDDTEYVLALPGSHQLHNAAVVLQTVSALRERGFDIPEDSVSSGLSGVKWPARFELIQKNPLFILDGGHNPQCAEALAACIRELLPDKKIVFLYGTLADKDYPKVISHLIPFAQEFICLTPQNDRALSAVELAEYLLRQGVSAKASKTVEAGISEAIKKAGENGTVIAFGSLYLAGAIRNIVLKEGPVTSR